MDDERFFDALARGDRRAAATFIVESYGDDVLSLCRAMVRDEALAEDLTQDTYQRAIAGLDGFRADASPRTWLKTIARHLCIDHLRRAKRRPDGPGVSEAADVDGAVDQSPLTPELLLRRDIVALALDALDEQARALVVLRYRHEVGYPELADAFGQSQGALRMRVSRALATMRAQLAMPAQAASRRREEADVGFFAAEEAEEAGAPAAAGAPVAGFGGAAESGSAGPGAPPPLAAPSSPPTPAPASTFAEVLLELARPASRALRARLDALVVATP